MRTNLTPCKELVNDVLRVAVVKGVMHLDLAIWTSAQVIHERQRPAKVQSRFTRKHEASLAEVLSEREYHCVARAAFMAELVTTDSRSAIILDDPVSSLDHTSDTFPP